MRVGAERLLMPAPTVEQFVEAVKVTVLENRRWVPPPNKGFLHIRPLLIGSGPVISLTPAPEFIFLILVTPMRDYSRGGLEPINLVVETEIHRAVCGGAGSVKAIGNYAAILKAHVEAKANGFFDVLLLDSVHQGCVEETSTANVFLVKDKIISTPALEEGTVLPGITRKCVIEIARSQGYRSTLGKAHIRRRFYILGFLLVILLDLTSVSSHQSEIGSVTYLGKKVSYCESGPAVVSQQLHRALSNIQMGQTEDKLGWTVTLK